MRTPALLRLIFIRALSEDGPPSLFSLNTPFFFLSYHPFLGVFLPDPDLCTSRSHHCRGFFPIEVLQIILFNFSSSPLFFAPSSLFSSGLVPIAAPVDTSAVFFLIFSAGLVVFGLSPYSPPLRLSSPLLVV